MSTGPTPTVVGRRAFPCCGGRVRLAYSPTPLTRRCPACGRRFQVEFRPAEYTARRVGGEVFAISWIELVRRGVGARAVRDDSPGQLGFSLGTEPRAPRR